MKMNKRPVAQVPQCASCAHAMRIARSELLCGASQAYYACDDERSMPRLKAIWFNACGRDGRFFVPAGETAPPNVTLEH